MFEKTCRCGKSKKNFKIDIGDFFVDDCCLEAGYNELGELVKKSPNPVDLPSQDELDAKAALLKEDTSPEPEDPRDESQEDAESEAKAKAEKEAAKAQAKAEKAAAKAQAKAQKEAAKAQAKGTQS
jgi:uncharacterized membrane protein YqiK